MRVIYAPQPGRLRGKLDKLVGVGEAAGRIVEPGGHADRALLHALPQHGLHVLDLGAAGSAVGPAGGRDAERGVAHDIDDVDGDPAVEQRQVLGHRRPAGLDVRPAVQAGVEVYEPLQVVRRPEGGVGVAVDADQLGRDALVDLGHVLRVGQQHQPRVRVDVDEPGADDLPGGVYRPRGGNAGGVAPDDRQRVALDADGGAVAGVPRAVHDEAARYEQIEHWLPVRRKCPVMP